MKTNKILLQTPIALLLLVTQASIAQSQITVRGNGTISGTVQLPNKNPNFNNGTTRVDTDSQGRYFRNGVLIYSADTFNAGLVGVRSNGTYYVDFRGIPLVSPDGTLTSALLQGNLKNVQRFNNDTPVKLWGNLQDELVLQGDFVGTVTDPTSGQQYQGTFRVRGQGPRYSATNGSTSPTVFDFQSHYQGTDPKIPAQVTVTRYSITAMPIALTLTIPPNTPPAQNPQNPQNLQNLQNPQNPVNPVNPVNPGDLPFFEVNRVILEKQQAPIGPKSRVLLR
jgi:hypothetical protein